MNTTHKKPTENRARANARLAGVQALYQMEAASVSVETVIAEFCAFRLDGEIEGSNLHKADRDYFTRLVRGVVEAQDRIDHYIESNLAKNWKLARLDATARAILRAGVYELIDRADTPVAVVIDEYVEIANAFFDGDEPGFVNGVLDAAAKSARQGEIADAGLDGGR